MSDDLSKREVWIDTARGIAILLVVLGHIFPMEHKANQIIYSLQKKHLSTQVVHIVHQKQVLTY